jgi:hypothetical protein
MNLEEELTEIASKINSEESQLRLQQILTENQENNQIISQKSHELLHHISKNLTKSLLESKLYHMISSSKIQAEAEGNYLAKSVLDFNGDFVWHDKTSKKMFASLNDSPNNLFSLMSPFSVRYLYSKFTSEILSRSKKIVFSYVLANSVELTSRATLVSYSSTTGVFKKGVYLETRLARHKVLNSYNLCISPILQFSDTFPLFTPLQITPVSFFNPDACFIELENLRITPFLKNESPYKKRKLDEFFPEY